MGALRLSSPPGTFQRGVPQFSSPLKVSISPKAAKADNRPGGQAYRTLQIRTPDWWEKEIAECQWRKLAAQLVQSYSRSSSAVDPHLLEWIVAKVNQD
jgi:hypothetical protein